MKRILILTALLATPAFCDIEINRDEVYPPKANIPAGCQTIVNGVNNNRDVAGAVVGGVIGGGFTARTVVGAVVGAYMARPSGGGHGGSNP